MRYWHYWAYDSHLEIVEGYLIAETAEASVLSLRQQGLQAYKLMGTTKEEFMRDQYLQQLKARARQINAHTIQSTDKS